MKVVYVKVIDPIAWMKPDHVFHEEDRKFMKCNVVRVAGILIEETDTELVIGEVGLARDNPELDEYEILYPRYRYVEIIAKCSILYRQDFEIKEETTK